MPKAKETKLPEFLFELGSFKDKREKLLNEFNLAKSVETSLAGLPNLKGMERSLENLRNLIGDAYLLRSPLIRCEILLEDYSTEELLNLAAIVDNIIVYEKLECFLGSEDAYSDYSKCEKLSQLAVQAMLTEADLLQHFVSRQQKDKQVISPYKNIPSELLLAVFALSRIWKYQTAIKDYLPDYISKDDNVEFKNIPFLKHRELTEMAVSASVCAFKGWNISIQNITKSDYIKKLKISEERYNRLSRTHSERSRIAVIKGIHEPRENKLHEATPLIKEYAKTNTRHTEITELIWNYKKPSSDDYYFRYFQTSQNRRKEITRKTINEYVKEQLREIDRKDLIWPRS